MTETSNSIFNRKAVDRLRSPDDLEKYVRIANPSVWVALAACAALLMGLLAWGIFGSVTTSVSGTGVVVDGEAMCFLSAEDAAKVHVGDETNFGGNAMTVSEVTAIPLSRDEAGKVLTNDYLVNSLVKGDWAYQVVFDGDTSSLAEGVPITMSITVERIAPITLILGGNFS